MKYENAWRNKETNNWDTVGFSIIDNYGLKHNNDAGSPDVSYFNWNEVVKNLCDGSLKSLNFDLFKSLKTSTAKRMYRFLDKRFGIGQHSWEFDLEDFAHNKVGMTTGYPASLVKQRMNTAIKELENIGFIKKKSKSERYKKQAYKRGKWKISFEKGDLAQLKSAKKDLNQMELDFVKNNSKPRTKTDFDEKQEKIFEKLVARKVSTKKARDLVGKFEYEFLDEKIEILDSMSIPYESLMSSINSEDGFKLNFIKCKYRYNDNLINNNIFG